MFEFEKPQSIFEIGRVKVGGQPSELPTVLIGTMFYRGQKLYVTQIREFWIKKKQIVLLKTGRAF